MEKKTLSEIDLGITEPEYRELPCLSYSFMSGLDKMGISIVNNPFKGGVATLMGQITEDMVFGYHDPSKYRIEKVPYPGEILKKAIDDVFKYHVHNSTPILHKDELYNKFKEAFKCDDNIAYWPNKDEHWRAVKAVGEGVKYINFILESNNMKVLDPESYDKCSTAATTLLSHPFTKDIFLKEDGVDAMPQFKGKFMMRGHEFKFMVDLTKIDHNRKKVIIYDMKTGVKRPEKFQDSYHLWRYDIQDFIYYNGVKKVIGQYYPDYEVNFMKFIFMSFKNGAYPLIYEGLGSHVKIWEGYYYKGEKVRGLEELIDNFEWYKKTGFSVRYTEKVSNAKGVVPLDIVKLK